MAVSGLEQRRVPLVVASNVWSPWGPGMVVPYPEDGSDEHYYVQDECKPTQQTRQRSLSWGGYSTYAQRSSLPWGGLSSHAHRSRRGILSDTDSQSEISAPRSAVSDSALVCGGRPGRRGREACPRRGAAPELEVAPTPAAGARGVRESGPMLLGSRQPVSKTKQGVENPDAGPLTSTSSEVAGAGNAGKTAITTLAIRNLPYGLEQQELLQAVDDSGFAGLYDFVYLPHKFKEHRNLGFAFINFVSEDVASRFSAEWQRTRRFAGGSMRKPVNISPAAVQGSQNQLKATSHKMNRVKNSSFRPLVLDGTPVSPLPEPSPVPVPMPATAAAVLASVPVSPAMETIPIQMPVSMTPAPVPAPLTVPVEVVGNMMAAVLMPVPPPLMPPANMCKLGAAWC